MNVEKNFPQQLNKDTVTKNTSIRSKIHIRPLCLQAEKYLYGTYVSRDQKYSYSPYFNTIKYAYTPLMSIRQKILITGLLSIRSKIIIRTFCQKDQQCLLSLYVHKIKILIRPLCL